MGNLPPSVTILNVKRVVKPVSFLHVTIAMLILIMPTSVAFALFEDFESDDALIPPLEACIDALTTDKVTSYYEYRDSNAPDTSYTLLSGVGVEGNLHANDRCVGSVTPRIVGDLPTVEIPTTTTTTAQVNTQVTLTATATDTEDGDLNAKISWSSSPTGVTGTGNTIMWTPQSAVNYMITATITDSDGNIAYATHTISVNSGDPPIINIDATIPTTIQVNTQVTLTATATDTEDGDSAANIVWSSNPVGLDATSHTVVWTPQNHGKYTITATITDSDGNTAYGTHVITVDQGNAPTINFTSNTPTLSQINVPVMFAATASDVEDDANNIDSDSKIQWSSSPVSVTGTGSSVTWTPTQSGTYVITATITDSDGNVTYITHEITIERDNLPIVDITSDVFTTTRINTPVTLTATVSDVEDDNAGLANNIVWTSSPGGQIGTGDTVTWTPTQSGTYVITATITDSAGNTQSDTHEITANSGDPPTISIPAYTPIKALVGSQITFNATITDTEDDNEELANKIVWTSNPASVSHTGPSVTWTPTQSGTYVITATITDSDGNIVRDTHTITVDRGTPPTLEINSGAPTTTRINTQVTLTATVSDVEDDNAGLANNIVWSSNPAGVTGTGSSVTWTPNQTGTYVITATITDSDDHISFDTHTLIVNRGAPPTINILSAPNTASVKSPVTLTATVSDVEDDNAGLANNIVWSSNPAGVTGTGSSVTWTPTQSGTYVITATITDSDGNMNNYEHEIAIDRGNPPTIGITSESNTALVNSQITLTATVSDVEDDNAGLANNIVWSSNPAGVTGTGSSVTWTPTQSGTYVITATITDSDGNIVSDTYTITTNRGSPPSLEIRNNVPDSTRINSPITITATVSDVEDDNAGLANNIVWSSNPASVTGTGSSVTWTPNQTGTYVITATVTDSTGYLVRDTHTLTVDRGTPPTLEINSGVSAETRINTQVTLTATVSDVEDDNAGLANNIVWSSNPASVTGTGSSVTWTPNQTGTYVITATITDSDENTISDTHLIIVNPSQISTVKNAQYQQPPIPTQSYATKMILGHPNPITPTSDFSTIVHKSITNATGLWTELYPNIFDFEVLAKPLADEDNYEFNTQPISVIHLNFVDEIQGPAIGLYLGYFFDDQSTRTFINHTITVQMGQNDCKDTYQQFNEHTLSSIVAHEIGHYLQIGHTSDEGNLMWAPDGIDDGTFNSLGWTIPTDPLSQGTPYTQRGLNLYIQLQDLNDEREKLQAELDQTPESNIDERNRIIELYNENIVEYNTLVNDLNCVENPTYQDANSTG